MATMVKTKLVKVGNSQGIRIPKLLLAQLAVESEVELTVQQGALVVRPVPKVRQGWREQFHTMAAAADDQLLDLPSSTWDDEEWVW